MSTERNATHALGEYDAPICGTITRSFDSLRGVYYKLASTRHQVNCLKCRKWMEQYQWKEAVPMPKG